MISLPALLPVFLLMLTTLGLVASLMLFISLKREFQVWERRGFAKHTRLEMTVQDLHHRIEELSPGLESTVPARINATDPALQPRMNLARRSHVLGLHKRGEDPKQIAASLGLSCGEVELILKLQMMMLERY